MIEIGEVSSTLDIFEENFDGDWRQGEEIQKVVITQRLYQISSNSTQAWFSNSKFKIKRSGIQIWKFPYGSFASILESYEDEDIVEN